MLSVITILPFYVYFGTKNNPQEFFYICAPTYIAEKSVILFGFFLVFSSITFSCYVAIGYLLWRRANNMASNLERKTCLVFFTSMFSYYVLYMPGIIVNYLQAEDLAINVSNVIVHANFFINPILYCFHPSYNQAYRKVFGFNVVNKSEPNIQIVYLTRWVAFHCKFLQCN